ncbi:MAG: hypothetical protein ACRDNW_10855 [Trebonia sp.]
MNYIDHSGNPPADTGQEIVKPPSTTPPTVAAAQPAPIAPPVTMTTPSRPDLAATVLAERARWRVRSELYRALARLVRRRHVSRRAVLTALNAEDQHIGTARDPGRKTHAEALIQALGKQSADGSLAKSQRGVDRRVRKADRLKAKQARLRARAEHRAEDRVPHPVGGHDTAVMLERAGTDLRGRIDAEMASGSLKHTRFPRWIRYIPKFVLIADFSMLLYFFAGITNVNWAAPVSPSLGFAGLLAAMVTAATYGFLAFAGYRLRTYKDHSGAIARHALDGLTKAACGAAAGGAAAVAALMFVRMRVEVLDALGPGGWVTAALIAVVLSAVSALANFLVILIHALDGSDEVARLDAIGANTRGPLAKAHRMREKAATITFPVAIQQRRADRQATSALTKAGRHLAVADQYLQAGRSLHQAAGPHADRAVDPARGDGVVGYLNDETRPMPDLRPLRKALEHVSSPLPEPETPGPAQPPSEADVKAS